MEKKWQKWYFTCYNLLIAQHLLQVHYQISIIILKEVLELNINKWKMWKYDELKINI